jgi:hypothetical protein
VIAVRLDRENGRVVEEAERESRLADVRADVEEETRPVAEVTERREVGLVRTPREEAREYEEPTPDAVASRRAQEEELRSDSGATERSIPSTTGGFRSDQGFARLSLLATRR